MHPRKGSDVVYSDNVDEDEEGDGVGRMSD